MKKMMIAAGTWLILLTACAGQDAGRDGLASCAEGSCKHGRVCDDGVCLDPEDAGTNPQDASDRPGDAGNNDNEDEAFVGRDGDERGDSANGEETGEPDDTGRADVVDPDVSAYSPARYEEDVRFIAQPRPPGSAHNLAVREYCAAELQKAGFDVEVFEYGPGTNVIGTLEGSDSDAPTVVVGAHFDSVRSCDSANDNATGVAAVLEAARVLGTQRHAGTLIMACWDEEERGKLGSNSHAFRLRGVADYVIVMDMIGYTDHRPFTQRVPAGFEELFPQLAQELADRDYRADFAIATANHEAGPAALALERAGETQGIRIAPLVLEPGVDVSGEVEQLRRSDHASFWDVNIPALLLTDTGNYRGSYYHCGRTEDSVDILDFQFAAQMTRAVIGASAALLRAQ